MRKKTSNILLTYGIMELYVTKKVDTGEDFSLAPLETLPYMHIITPQVVIKRDASGSYYVADFVQEGGNPTGTVNNLIKLKKLISKQGFKKDASEDASDAKYKLADDIVWVKASPIMYYKRENILVPCNKLVVNYPVQLQVSCKSENIYSVSKPYNVYNMFWTVDYVLVDKNFNFDILAS